MTILTNLIELSCGSNNARKPGFETIRSPPKEMYIYTNKKQRTQEGLVPRSAQGVLLCFIKDSEEEREKVRSTAVRGSPETQGW